MRTGKFCLWLLLVSLPPLLLPATGQAQGLIIGGSGAMHRSMAGASTAVGADALGALYWNPAVISGLPNSEAVIGGEFLIPDTHVGSTIPAGAFGPLGPTSTLSGYTRSDSGVGLLSGIGVVQKMDSLPVTMGVAMVTLAGGGVNFPGNPANPILAPVGPFNRFVLGPQAASLTVVSVMPTMSVQFTERLAVGFSPMLDASLVSFDPAFFGPANDANGDGLSSFPTGTHSRPFWGGGFRTGFTYKLCEGLIAGFSYTSPQWFETWRFNARDEVGNPFQFRTRATLPAIFSGGLSYVGIPGCLLSADLRWFDYRATNLYGEPARNGGAGWDSIWSVALGAKHNITDGLSVQLGYLYNQNPVPSNLTLFNTMLPAVTQHTISAGTYLQMTESIGMSLAYIHGFKSSVSGSVSPLQGMTTTLDTEYDSIAFGMHIKFGGQKPAPRMVSTEATVPTVPPCCPAPCCPEPSSPPCPAGFCPTPAVGGAGLTTVPSPTLPPNFESLSPRTR